MRRQLRSIGALASSFASVSLLLSQPAMASSHREAPGITKTPKVDGTDFYMFNSYESGRDNFVTIIADYLPLQDPYGGPNYFDLDSKADYDINIDTNGDAKEDLVFRFNFRNFNRNIAVNANGVNQQIPLINAGSLAATNIDNLNRVEFYSVRTIRGSRKKSVTNAITGSRDFLKPVDNIGNKSIPDYDSYAFAHLYEINIPDCAVPGRMFVGQRKEPFQVNLGETFDLVNLNPVGSTSGEASSTAGKNITSIILEVAKSCLLSGSNTVVGGWTTASLDGKQVSRLANPLVNEVIIGLPDKDKFNASKPKDDSRNFLKYFTNPSLPELLEILFSVDDPDVRRDDLVQVFLTGVPGLNLTRGTGEMMRLNTAIAAVPAASQNALGVVGGDTAGYPNGRRPGDDVVDISLRAVMGVLLDTSVAPAGQLPYTDGAAVNASFFAENFPYLLSPLPGSPN